MFEKLLKNFNLDLKINKQFYVVINDYFSFVWNNQKAKDPILNSNLNEEVTNFVSLEAQINNLIEEKQNSLITMRQIKNVLSERKDIKNRFIDSQYSNNLREEEKIDLGLNHSIGNKFEFSNYPKKDYNELEMERANIEKMHNFQVSLMDIFKGEQETKFMRMNLLSELEDLQEMSNNRIDQ